MNALKTPPAIAPVEIKSEPKGVFRLFFEEARTVKPAASFAGAKAAPSVARTAMVTGRQRVEAESSRLSTARGAIQAKAQAMVDVRASHEVTADSEVSRRAVEMIRDDLVAEFEALAAPVANPSPNPRSMEALSPPVINRVDRGPVQNSFSPEQRAHQALALIEKIEVFVKSARPAMALTLNNSLGARVEIERLGPREITLKLIGQNGLPSAETISCLREEMRARGLKVAAFSIA